MRTAKQKKNISDKCKESIQIRKNKKFYIGSMAPYGYILDKNNKKLLIDKNVSHIVYLIFDLYEKGYGLTYIATYLNDRGILIPSQYRKQKKYISRIINGSSYKWEKSSIRKILNNRVYNGYYNYSSEKTHSEIINDELWNKVSDRIKNQKNIVGNDFFDVNGNEFSNKVICSICGHNFTLENSRCKNGVVRYLRCSCYDKRGNKKIECSNKNAIRYDDLKDIVSFYLDNEIFSNINYNDLLNKYKEELKLTNFAEKRKYIKQEKKVLEELFLNNIKEVENIDEQPIQKIKKELINKENEIIKRRINELNLCQKELYKLTRTYKIKKDYFKIDKFLIDKFIDKIYLGELIDFNRKITIILK